MTSNSISSIVHGQETIEGGLTSEAEGVFPLVPFSKKYTVNYCPSTFQPRLYTIQQIPCLKRIFFFLNDEKLKS